MISQTVFTLRDNILNSFGWWHPKLFLEMTSQTVLGDDISNCFCRCWHKQLSLLEMIFQTVLMMISQTVFGDDIQDSFWRWYPKTFPLLEDDITNSFENYISNSFGRWHPRQFSLLEMISQKVFGDDIRIRFEDIIPNSFWSWYPKQFSRPSGKSHPTIDWIF